MPKPLIIAKNILALLLMKHSRDFVCVPECKTGGSIASRYQSIDLWCMAKSWARPKTIAYEIKISRNDFLRDDKWRTYLDYCSEFYFAAPPGIIDPSELPDEAGLLICSKNAKILYIKKKAPERTVKIPESIFRYILMWRTEICGERSTDHTQYWQDWLRKKSEKRDLGYLVSKTIRKHVNKVDLKNEGLRRENKRLQDTKDVLDKLGFKTHEMDWDTENRLRRRIQEINTGISGNILDTIDVSIDALQKTRKALEGD